MTRRHGNAGTAISTVAIVVFGALSAFAGPPLLCHRFDLGDAQTIPFGEESWSDIQSGLSAEEIVVQTLDVLSPSAPILVRMETLRRASIYAKKIDGVGAGLLMQLLARQLREGADNRAHALLQFDVGYLLATCEQLGGRSPGLPDWLGGAPALPSLQNVSGYDLLRRAEPLLGEDPQFHFACAVVTAYPRESRFTDHLRCAIEGTEDNTPLARNIVAVFGDGRTSLEGLRARYGAIDAGERR